MIAAILITIVLFSAVSLSISIGVTAKSKNQAAVLEVAARQRTLAERYVKEVLLVRAGSRLIHLTPPPFWHVAPKPC